jgi:hypothetical protein
MALTNSGGSGALRDVGYFLERNGIVDGVLPFLLIFTIIFAVLERIKLFGKGKKNINVMISLMISLLTVAPHLTGAYPRNYDPIVIINTLIPSAAVMGVGIILVMFLLGMFGKEFVGGGAPGWIVFLILFTLAYIFGATVGWWASPTQTFGSWFGTDISSLVIIILVFGLVMWFITSEPPKPGPGQKGFLERLGRDLFK